jgi:hypothetical protein
VLGEGRLGGAVLDAFATAPLRDTLREVFIEDFRRFADGRPLRNVVDERLGYVGSHP